MSEWKTLNELMKGVVQDGTVEFINNFGEQFIPYFSPSCGTRCDHWTGINNEGFYTWWCGTDPRWKPAPKSQVRWVNFYSNNQYGCSHSSRKVADNKAGPGRIACIRVKFTEGEGLK